MCVLLYLLIIQVSFPCDLFKRINVRIPGFLYLTQSLDHALLVLNVVDSITEFEVVFDCSFWLLILVLDHLYDLVVLAGNSFLYLQVYVVVKCLLVSSPKRKEPMNFSVVQTDIKKLL